MTIHPGHPFPTPDDPVRRLRGRIGATVSLWTAGTSDDDRAGLTVSSWLVGTGVPVLGIFLIQHLYSMVLVDIEENSGIVSSMVTGVKILPIEEEIAAEELEEEVEHAREKKERR